MKSERSEINYHSLKKNSRQQI